jgi:hypothetical protein
MENFDSPDKSSDKTTSYKTTTSYNLGAFKQLIDLNGDSVNFEVFFTVKCDNEDDVFDMLVIDQENLDKNQVLKYKKITDGGISGKVKANTNTYLNYFLILKSENECPVTVEISKRELDESEIEYPQEPEEQEDQLEQHLQQEQLERREQPQAIPNPYHAIHHIQQKSSINWKKVIIVCVIVSTGLGLYYYFTKTKKDEKEHSSKRLEKSNRSSHFSPEHKSSYDHKTLQHKSLEYKEKHIPSFQVKSESSSTSNYKSFIPPVIKKQEITSVRSSDTSSSKEVAVSSLIQRLKNARKNRK